MGTKAVTDAGLRLTQAVKLGLRRIPDLQLREYVQAPPGATVHEICRDSLGGLHVKWSAGMRRAYASIYGRMKRARRQLTVR